MAKTKQKREFLLKTDLPLHIIAFLALLAIPRVVLHDLKIVDFSSPIYMFFTLAPYAVWIVLASVRKTKHPFADFLVLGLIFGLMLGATHQILWDASWGSNVPHIGGTFAGQLNSLAEGLILRSAAFISSMTTGTVIGVALGVVASLSMRARAKAK